jgi:thiamine biosynthesis lipoprotein
MGPIRPHLHVGLLVTVAILVAIGQWRIAKNEANQRIAVVARPQGVMGTDCTLAIVVTRENLHVAHEALERAESVIRSIEARMSSWLDHSEISRFAAAKPGREIALSSDTLSVLRAAREAFLATERAFDVTCRPQIQLWREAGEAGRLPSSEQLARARNSSHWNLVELTEDGVLKLSDTVCLDLGGIAKGYAIDRALEAMQGGDVYGAMVDIGGDLACSGQQADGGPWQVDVKSPDEPDMMLRLQVTERAVATSGNYARYITIDGQQYSHIVDPRTSLPADSVASVTVVSPTAQSADVWATALSVLGADGLRLLPGDIQALMVVAADEGKQTLCTAAFRDFLAESPPEDLHVWLGDKDLRRSERPMPCDGLQSIRAVGELDWIGRR